MDKKENKGVYRNSTEIAQLAGQPVYMKDIVDACLYGRLNLFLQGDTGSGKTQLARDAMNYFGNKSMFILGRNDMDTRELFQQINLEKLKTAKSSAELKELTDKVDYHLIVVDELPNCVPAVRAQLFNLFDGFVELNGRAYPIGKDYSVGIATGNIGQQFTESSNELGRALKDRMHVIVDTDYFMPRPSDTLEILAGNTNPRVEFLDADGDPSQEIIRKSKVVSSKEPNLAKLIYVNYLLHGLDYCSEGSKRKMKDRWPNSLDNHAQGSDEQLVLPISPRAAKSILRLSQALDDIVSEKGAKNIDDFESIMQAYKLVSAYSGILNEASVQADYNGDHYKAIDAIIQTTKQQFNEQEKTIAQGLKFAKEGKTNSKVLNKLTGRWEFMKDIFENLAQKQNKSA